MRSILFTAVYLSLNLCMRFVLINTEIVELTLFHFGAFVFFYQLNKQKKNIRFNNPMWTHQQSPPHYDPKVFIHQTHYKSQIQMNNQNN